jgi:hypothetical protein
MAKIIDYPRGSFKKSLEVGEAVDYMGGSCSMQSCGDRMGMKMSGALQAIVGAAKKYNIIEGKGSDLSITGIYRNIKLAYDDTERIFNLRKAFLSPPLFEKMYEKFKGRELPVELLPKLFIREYGIESSIAARVAGYFVDGARMCEILVDNKLIIFNEEVENLENKYEVIESSSENVSSFSQVNLKSISPIENQIILQDEESFMIHILGPGINSKLTLTEEEDFIILDAMISKLKKKMKN